MYPPPHTFVRTCILLNVYTFFGEHALGIRAPHPCPQQFGLFDSCEFVFVQCMLPPMAANFSDALARSLASLQDRCWQSDELVEASIGHPAPRLKKWISHTLIQLQLMAASTGDPTPSADEVAASVQDILNNLTEARKKLLTAKRVAKWRKAGFELTPEAPTSEFLSLHASTNYYLL